MSLFPAGKTNNLCATWYYPKYTCYGIFGALACLYTISVHTLFRCLILTRPQIAQPVVAKQQDGSARRRRRLAVVTGSNTGVGYQTAKALVSKHGIDVILACRSRDKALKAAEEINAAGNNAGMNSKATFLHPCDLSSFASVEQFAKVVKEQYDTVDILVNNAGLNRTGRSEDGYDLLFQSCFLGHFLLTKLLFDLFPEDGTGRIVNLSSVKHHFRSNWTGFVSLDETFWRNSAVLHHRKNESYPNAKQASVFFTLELNRRFFLNNSEFRSPKRVRAFAANPGAVNSEIWRHVKYQGLVRPIFRLLFLNTEQGAATSVAAAVGEDFVESDFYLEPYWMPASARRIAPFPVLEMMGPFAGFRVTQPRLPHSESAVIAAGEALWTVSEELTKCKFDRGLGDSAVAASTTEATSVVSPSSVPSRTKTVDESGVLREPRAALGIVTNTAPTKRSATASYSRS